MEDHQAADAEGQGIVGDGFLQTHRLGKFLGKGGFAKCYECTNLDTKKVTAAKIIPKSTLQKSRQRAKLLSEIKIHRSLQHPFIVQFEHVFEDSMNVYILLELCNNQSLNDLIKRRKRLPESEVKSTSWQILQALKYLRLRNIIHRGVKLGDIVLDSDLRPKLTDFGSAEELSSPDKISHEVVSTASLVAPELLGESGHSFPVDIWYFGLNMSLQATGSHPFEAGSIKDSYDLVRNKDCKPHFLQLGLSPEFTDLVTRMLNCEPQKRPTLTEIASHPFFSDPNSIPDRLSTVTFEVKKEKSDNDRDEKRDPENL